MKARHIRRLRKVVAKFEMYMMFAYARKATAEEIVEHFLKEETK